MVVSNVTCTKRLNEARQKGRSRFDVDLHDMERMVLWGRERAESEVHAVCGKVGGYARYTDAFGPLAGRLHAIIAEGQKRSAYSFPGARDHRLRTRRRRQQSAGGDGVDDRQVGTRSDDEPHRALLRSRGRALGGERLSRPGDRKVRAGHRFGASEARDPFHLFRANARHGGGGFGTVTQGGARGRILDGPLAKSLLTFGAPLALGMGLQTTFNLVDAYLISRLDASVRGPAWAPSESATRSPRSARS